MLDNVRVISGVQTLCKQVSNSITILIQKIMKKFLYLLIALIACTVFSSCHRVAPGAGEESVLVHKPWFFGHGGVDKDAVTTGSTWCW